MKSITTNTKYAILCLISAFLVLGLIFTASIISNQNKSSISSSEASNIAVLLYQGTPVLNYDNTYTMTIRAQATGATSLNTQGMQMRLNFDYSKFKITNIAYVWGNQSNSVGQGNTDLASINQVGQMTLVAEIQNASGQILSNTTKTDIITLSYSGPYSSNVFSLATGYSNQFYGIDSQGALIPEPIAINVSKKKN